MNTIILKVLSDILLLDFSHKKAILNHLLKFDSPPAKTGNRLSFSDIYRNNQLYCDIFSTLQLFFFF